MRWSVAAPAVVVLAGLAVWWAASRRPSADSSADAASVAPGTAPENAAAYGVFGRVVDAATRAPTGVRSTLEWLGVRSTRHLLGVRPTSSTDEAGLTLSRPPERPSWVLRCAHNRED